MVPCPSCSAEQSETSRFCSECGVALNPELVATVTHRPGPSPAEPRVHSSLSDSSHHGQFLPGTKVADRYRIVSLVGRGGMGEVYRADDLKLGHTVALKFLPGELADDARRLEYFHSEVRLTRQISHPNICRVYDIGEVDGQHFLSMEYIDGEDLKILLRRIGRLPQDKGVQIAQQLCAGLAAAHDRGILHRDLKPANIMIDGRGQVRITDFGLAKLASEGAEHEIAGTPAYMSPEQLTRGETAIQSDLYALGLILYELFTGKAVHKIGSIPERMRAHEQSSLPPPSGFVEDMDPTVERVILRCLEKEPSDRPDSAQAVSAALPGGDPLVAALAAGETPSPAMVAAAGETGGLSLKVGITVLSVICALLIAMPILANRLDTHELSRLRGNAPVVLKDDAIQWIKRLGYESSVNSDAYHDSAYQFKKFKDFRYRQSSRPLHPRITRLFGGTGIWGMTEDNPSALGPGMVSVRLDPRKKFVASNQLSSGQLYSDQLLEFLAVPEADAPDEQAEATTAERWMEYFRWVGLDRTDFSPVTGAEKWKHGRPPIHTDDLSVWRGPEGSELQVIMGSRNNRLVYFRRVTNADDQSGFSATQSKQGGVAILTLLAVVVAGLLGLRNLKLGRSDTQGALRFAVYYFAADIFLGVVVSHHVSDLPTESELAANHLIYALARSLRVWLYYVGFEPYARRLWPDLLITWSRVLSGRFRDPLVGRDLMVGVLFAVAFALAILAMGGSSMEDLNRATSVLSNILVTHQQALIIGLYYMAILVFCRVLTRNAALAVGLFAIIATLTATISLGDNPAAWSQWIVKPIFYGGLAMLYVRFGLLSAVTGLFCHWLLSVAPHTSDFGAWYAIGGNVALATVLVVACYGFYTSTLADRQPSSEAVR